MKSQQYDRVGSIDEALRGKGFDKRWVRWIGQWLASVKVKINVNESMGKDIICRRGLKQSDPLSPLLYAIVTDTLKWYATEDKE